MNGFPISTRLSECRKEFENNTKAKFGINYNRKTLESDVTGSNNGW
jgi:hypothetical protein